MEDADVSPKYLMELIPTVSKKLWDMFEISKYQNVRRYIQKWHKGEWGGWNNEEYFQNFEIFYKDEAQKEIDLDETLHRMPPELLVKIAIDLGIDTPGFLPMMPTFKNVLKDNNQSAHQNFTRAAASVHKDPDNAVALAASTLEGIIKTILEHKSFAEDGEKLKNLPLSKLVNEILKRFKMQDDDCPREIFTLAKQLGGLGATLDDLRSDKSTAHGKGSTDYVVDDYLWATLTVNVVATLGLFMWEYFSTRYSPDREKSNHSNQPIDLSEIPF